MNIRNLTSFILAGLLALSCRVMTVGSVSVPRHESSRLDFGCTMASASLMTPRSTRDCT